MESKRVKEALEVFENWIDSDKKRVIEMTLDNDILTGLCGFEKSGFFGVTFYKKEDKIEIYNLTDKKMIKKIKEVLKDYKDIITLEKQPKRIKARYIWRIIKDVLKFTFLALPFIMFILCSILSIVAYLDGCKEDAIYMLILAVINYLTTLKIK